MMAEVPVATNGEARPERGIRCPRCHCCDLRVGKTVRLSTNRIRRYRYCRNCGKSVTTLEVTLSHVKPD